MALFARRVVIGIAMVAAPAAAFGPDEPSRMFPTFRAAAPPAGCVLPADDNRELQRDGLLKGRAVRPGSAWRGAGDPAIAAAEWETEEAAYPPFRNLLCQSAVLQYHYARRERRSEHFSASLDAATLAAAALTAGLAGFGAGAKAILGAGLAGGVLAAGRGYKAPEARQALYRKGEAALQCIDRAVRSTDPIYALGLGTTGQPYATIDSVALDDIEVAAGVIAATTDQEP